MRPKELKIEYVDINTLNPYPNNAKIHTSEQVQQIMKSIEEFGFNDPIAVWGADNEIVAGHGRVLAGKEMGIKKVPIIRLDSLSDEERRAYMLAHNQLTMNTGFNLELLDVELEAIEEIDMSNFGFGEVNFDWSGVEDLDHETYEEPEKELLECPACHHKDTAVHFKKVAE